MIREENVKVERVARSAAVGVLLCIVLVLMLAAGLWAQGGDGMGTVGDVVLQLALQSGYTGDSPDEAAAFLVANGILPLEAIGDLGRPADEEFFDAMHDAGVGPDLCVGCAVRAGVDAGSVVGWAIGTGIDPEIAMAEAIYAGGDAGAVFRAAMLGGVNLQTALGTCCGAGADLADLLPVALELGMSLDDVTAAAINAGLAPYMIARAIAPFMPPLPPIWGPGEEGYGDEERYASDLLIAQLIERMLADGCLGEDIAAALRNWREAGIDPRLFDLIREYFMGHTDFRPVASPFY